MRAAHVRHGRSRHHGISMIEVLIVLVLFSFGLIGMVGLQARAVQVSVSGEDSTRAALLANELASTMWGASTVNLPAATVTAWNATVGDASARGLPNGVGAVSVTGNVATITITWRAPYEDASVSHNYTTQVQLQ